MPVTIVCAMSADGKIAPVDRRAPRFGAADEARLETCCAAADVLVLGAGTLRSYGTTFRVRRGELLAARAGAGRPPQPASCVVSASGRLDPALPFFRQQVPRIIATTAGDGLDDLRGLAEIWPATEPATLLARFADRGWHQVALLGGGQLNAAWLAADLVDTVELTIAPLLFGGADAPTWCDGPGLPADRSLELVRSQSVDGLLFLTYRIPR